MVLKRDSLQSELESETGSQQFAVRNLLGLFAFHLEELSLAEETFLNICKEDPRNLNAWANLGYVYDRLKKEPEGAESVEKVFVLMGMGAGEASEVEPRLQTARCLAEQAYAHAYDVGLNTEQEHLEKLITAVKLYDKAIAYGGQEAHTKPLVSHRLDGMLKDQEDSEHKRMTSFSRTVKLLHEAMKSSNKHYKALAWCYIGLMLERQNTFPVVPMGIHDCGYSGTDPLECYCKAIETAKESPFILNRLAKVFLFLGKMDMATGMCNMALDILPDPELNWQAYCTRAKVYITTYVKDLEHAKLGLAGVPDRENLSKAKTDLEHILQACPCLKTYMDIGQFYMKDMYTFDVSEEAARQTYDTVCQAYCHLFKRLGLSFVKVQADTGSIGGKLSHEFQLPADIREDRLLICANCSFSANVETVQAGEADCPECRGKLTETKGIEVGHTFYLGTKYSSIFTASYNTPQNKPAVTEMGCFGLGVTRILAASIEVLSTEESIRWPGLLAPYQVCILPPKKGSKEEEAAGLVDALCDGLGEAVPALRGEVLLDVRTHLTIGKRLKDASRLGYPYVIVAGRRILEDQPHFEVCCQNTGETVFLTREGVFDFLSNVQTV
ncbi:UNVERIFIED_CONTAM: hypothetical protein FKN15_076651 [Acipenser sinensis]